jgi:hypothetical protein
MPSCLQLLFWNVHPLLMLLLLVVVVLLVLRFMLLLLVLLLLLLVLQSKPGLPWMLLHPALLLLLVHSRQRALCVCSCCSCCHWRCPQIICFKACVWYH